MKAHPGWRRVLGWVLAAAALVFVGAEVAGNVEQLRAFQWEVRPVLLAASVGAMSLVFLCGIVLWRMVLRRFGVTVAFWPLARAWFLANLTRYVPGMVWQFFSITQLGARLGLRPALAVTSLLVQMVLFLIAAGVVAVWLLPAQLAGPLEPAWTWLRLLSPMALLLVHPAAVRAVLRGVNRVSRRELLEWQGSWGGGLLLLAMSMLVWAGYGLAFYLFLASLTELPLAALPAVTAINALAFVAGYLAFFAPGGLGFKEGAMAVLLSGLLPRPVAFALAIASRLWTIAGELLPAALLWRARAARPLPPRPGAREGSGAEAGG